MGQVGVDAWYDAIVTGHDGPTSESDAPGTNFQAHLGKGTLSHSSQSCAVRTERVHAPVGGGKADIANPFAEGNIDAVKNIHVQNR